MDLSFLNNVELRSNNKEKSIKFNDNEVYLLKFIEYKNRAFSSYVKELIRKDLDEFTANRLSEEQVERIAKRVYKEKGR